MSRRCTQSLAVLPALLAAGCATGTHANPALQNLPFDDRDGLPFVDVRIGDGAPMPFLLDTGASPCVIDSGLAARIGIRAGPPVQRQGGAGTFSSNVTATPVTLGIGGSPLACAETLLVDLSGMTGEVGPISGIIGGDFFRGRVVAIDFESDRVSVFDRAGFAHEGERIPIRIERNRPYLTARLSVAGGPQDVARELLIDTGSQDNVDDPILAQGSQPGPEVSASGLGTGQRARSGTFNRVRIGGRTFENVSGVVPAVPLVGAGLLARFKLIFDYDGGWVILHDK